MRMGYPLPSHLRGLGSVVSSTAGSGAPPRPKTNLGHIKRRRTRLWLWWKIGYIVFCETFITAYTSARTVTGHLLAKIATVHYSVNSKAKIKGEKTGNKDQWRSEGGAGVRTAPGDTLRGVTPELVFSVKNRNFFKLENRSTYENHKHQ